MFGTCRPRLIFTTAAAAVAVLAGVPAQAFAGQVARPAVGRPAVAARPAGCAAPVAGQVTCAALVAPGGRAAASLAAGTPPAGISPANLRDAYGFQSSSSGMRQTVAVVVPYDNTTAETDMGTYRSQFSIPPCTTADGCFSKVNQTGGTSYPAAGPGGWALATAVSLDMISAVCPNCHILLVEATSPAITDVGAAENEAVSLGARFVTNAWLTPEATFGTSEPTYDSSYFNHPGVAITAPNGNGGYGTFYPAASPDVTAVGGTTLTASSTGSRGWTETAWSGTGSGCSPYEAKPSWQADTGCTSRMLNDVAALADPSTPIASYDTTSGGWVPAGGTVVASAIVAGAYALAGTPAAGSNPASYPYAHTGLMNDITTGSDGTCSPAPGYFCGAGVGYDGPTGVGTPASMIAFSSSGASPAGLIRSGIAGRCLDDFTGGTADGNKVDIWGCNGGSGSQIWTAQADGTIRIQGKCLDNRNNVAADNNPVQLYRCIGSPAQQWRSRYPGELENPASGRCLNDPSGATADGTQLVIFTCNQTASQDWALPYPTPTSAAGEITSGIPAPGAIVPGSECLDDFTGGTADGNKVDIWACNAGAGSQMWTVHADGTIRIQGKCLDNRGDGTANHNPVQLYTCNSSDAQQWIARSDGSLLNPETGKCLDDTNGSTTNGTQIGVYTCIESAGQKWTLPS